MNVYQENYATYVGKKPKWLVAPRRALFCVNTVLCLCCLGLMWLGLRCLGRLLSWAIAVLGDCCLGRFARGRDTARSMAIIHRVPSAPYRRGHATPAPPYLSRTVKV
jgi:hypothetical protein